MQSKMCSKMTKIIFIGLHLFGFVSTSFVPQNIVVEMKNKALSDIVSNLAGIGNTELSVISDFEASNDEQTQFFKGLNERGIFYNTFSLNALKNVRAYRFQSINRNRMARNIENPEECPKFQDPQANLPDIEMYSMKNHSQDKAKPRSFMVSKNSVYVRPSFVRTQRYFSTFFVWVQNHHISDIIGVFDSTVLQCDQFSDYGLYHPNNRFLFLMEDMINTTIPEKIQETFDNSKYASKHRYVAFINRIPPKNGVYSQDAKFKIYTCNFGAADSSEYNIRFSQLWVQNAKENEEYTINQFYGDGLKNLAGRHLKVGTNPWSHSVQATPIPQNIATPRFKYNDYWGYEVKILSELATILNFTYTIENHPDELWGNVEADGTWSGLVRLAKDGTVDFVMCDLMHTYSRSQVFDEGLTFDDEFMEIAAPKPLPVPKFFSIIYPLDPYVWASVAASFLLFGFVFWIFSNVEGALTNCYFHEWAESREAYWYAYGTLLGESITRDTNSSKAPALRITIAIWILYSLVITSSYMGNLRAFLITPTFTEPINTLAEVIESGLEWGLVLYGEEEEIQMAQSTDPVISKIWKDKTVVPLEGHATALNPVYAGEKVFLDWKNGLAPNIYKQFQLPSGEMLVHESPYPIFMTSYIGYAYYIVNPWRPRHDEIIRRMLEGGFINKWKEQTWYGMKMDYQDELKRTGTDGIRFNIKPLVNPLAMDSFMGVFYLLGLLLGLSCLLLLIEITWNECSRKRKTSFGKDSQKMYPSETKSFPNDAENPPKRSKMYGIIQHRISKDNFYGFKERTISVESKKTKH